MDQGPSVTGKWKRPTAALLGSHAAQVSQGVGTKAVLMDQSFADEAALVAWAADASGFGTPGLHLVRAGRLSEATHAALAESVPVVIGEHLTGFERNLDRIDDKSIEVTAKWTCKPGESADVLVDSWRAVGEQAHEIEEGMLRFHIYSVPGDEAVIIHETFQTNADLYLHLTKGTAAQHKSSIDAFAFPEAYYFRGPVSWLIRTYSRFMRLPATYAR